jgi:hypothetical protein
MCAKQSWLMRSKKLPTLRSATEPSFKQVLGTAELLITISVEFDNMFVLPGPSLDEIFYLHC